MQTQITNSFAALNDRLHAADQAFAVSKIDGKEAMQAAHIAQHGYKNLAEATIAYYGSKSMMSLLHGHGRSQALLNMEKNTKALIAKRDAQIIKALTKAGITEIPEFELVECSDGLEGFFNVAGKAITIRTILAGGYNIQRLHSRTLVRVN